MAGWQYCVVSVERYRDGTGGERELLSITRPGQHRTSITNPLGLVGVLNDLGAGGWELVDVESGNFYLKRAARSHVTTSATSAGVAITAGVLEQFSGQKRVKYFEGKTLTADDLTTEQQYVIQKRYLHNRLLHGIGIASGLAVSVSSDRSSPTVKVEPGIAIDRSGRELVLSSAVSIALSGAAPSLYVTLEYRERDTDPVPAPPDVTTLVFSRVEDGVSVSVSAQEPTGDGIVAAHLLRSDDGTWTISLDQ